MNGNFAMPYEPQKGFAPQPLTGIQLPKYKIPGEPERYRLTAAGGHREPTPSSQTVRFWFRTRLVSATGRAVHQEHGNVLRLCVHHSPLQQFIHRMVSLVPQRVRSFVETVFPEWFLPTSVVLKSERKGKEEEHGDPDELMDTEIRAYKQLKPVQGVVVPVYYGEVKCNGARSIILQDVGGASLSEPAGMLLEFDEFARLLEECHVALIGFGVCLEDTQLGNFILVDGKVMAIDFEMVSFDKTQDEMTQFMYMDISEMARRYRDRRKFLRREGWLEAAA